MLKSETSFNHSSSRPAARISIVSLIVGALTVLAAVLTVQMAHAKHGDAPSPRGKSWVCTMRGVISFGPPVGQIWQVVSGYGATQNEAYQRSISACMGSGYRMCTPQGCWAQ